MWNNSVRCNLSTLTSETRSKSDDLSPFWGGITGRGRALRRAFCRWVGGWVVVVWYKARGRSRGPSRHQEPGQLLTLKSFTPRVWRILLGCIISNLRCRSHAFWQGVIFFAGWKALREHVSPTKVDTILDCLFLHTHCAVLNSTWLPT